MIFLLLSVKYYCNGNLSRTYIPGSVLFIDVASEEQAHSIHPNHKEFGVEPVFRCCLDQIPGSICFHVIIIN